MIKLSVVPDKSGHSDLTRAVKELKSWAVYIGIKKGSPEDTRPDGPSNCDRAFLNEYGSSVEDIPERPFMRDTFERYADAFRDPMKAAAKALIVDEDEEEFRRILRDMGDGFIAYVQGYVREGTHFKKNAQSTLDAKAPETRPLIDTETMIQSFRTHVVKE